MECELYHGTTHKFDRFEITALANEQNHVGKGIYLTTCYYDAENHYFGIGPDLNLRISELADRFRQEFEERDTEDDTEDCDFEQLAKDELVGPGKYILKCEICESAKLFKLSKNRYIDMYVYDDENDESVETPELLALIEVFEEIENSSEYTGHDWRNEIVHEMTHFQIGQLVSRCASDVGGDYMRKWIMSLGYNGVEYEDASEFFPYMLSKGTKHFVVYEPELAKIVEVVKSSEVEE